MDGRVCGMCISTLLSIAKGLFKGVIPVRASMPCVLANSWYVSLLTSSNLMCDVLFLLFKTNNKKDRTGKLFPLKKEIIQVLEEDGPGVNAGLRAL